MPDRRTRAFRLAQAMHRCGIVRTVGVAFSRPCVLGTGIPVESLWDNFLGGDSIRSIARDFDLKPAQVEDAIRFHSLYPRCDFSSFWTDHRTVGFAAHLEQFRSGGDA